jgi:hypothetical protein
MQVVDFPHLGQGKIGKSRIMSHCVGLVRASTQQRPTVSGETRSSQVQVAPPIDDPANGGDNLTQVVDFPAGS